MRKVAELPTRGSLECVSKLESLVTRRFVRADRIGGLPRLAEVSSTYMRQRKRRISRRTDRSILEYSRHDAVKL